VKDFLSNKQQSNYYSQLLLTTTTHNYYSQLLLTTTHQLIMDSTPLHTVLGPNRLASMNYILRAHGIDSFLGSNKGETDVKIHYHGDTWAPDTGLSVNKLRIGFYLSNNGVYLGTWGIRPGDNDTTIRWKQRVIEVCDNWRTGPIPHCKALGSSPNFPARYMEVTMLSVESVIDLVKKFM